MRAGTWGGAVSTENARVTINGQVVPAHRIAKVSIQSGMRDGHPAAETAGSWCVEARIEWADPADVAASAAEPFSGSSWLPAPGSTVVVESGDAATGQWWVQHRGFVDDTSGSLADGTAVTTTVDRVEDLDGRVTIGAILSKQAPSSDGLGYREVGMQSTFLVDRCLRRVQGDDTGWYATPARTWETIGSAPNMGSLWPEVGSITSTGTSSPAWYGTDYGVAPTNYSAEYALIGSATQPILTVALGGPSSSGGSIRVCDADGKGAYIGQSSGDLVTYGTYTSSGAHWSVPRNSATRAALFFRRDTTTSQTLILRLDDGREFTRTAARTDYPNGWAADRVIVNSPTGTRFGWWMVESNKPSDPAYRWATLNHTPTARVRVGDMPWWTALWTRSWVSVADELADQVDAECAAMWLDEDGAAQWAGRGVLEAQGVAQTVTTTLDVDDVQWESRRRSMARSVWINYERASIDMGWQGQLTRNLWSADDIDLGPGETEVHTVATPDDEDWLQVDTTPHKVAAWGRSFDFYNRGSIYGGTRYNAGDGEGQVWEPFIGTTINRVNSTTLEVTVWTDASIPGHQRTKTVMPKDNNAFSRLNNPSLVVRGRARTKWVQGEQSVMAGTLGPARYTHDVGRRVQTNSNGIANLLNWLKGVVSSTNPTVTGLVLSHDPRRQIGDKVRVQDRHVTGLWFDVLVQQRDADLDEMTDSISGRVTAWGAVTGLSLQHPAGPTALTPPTNMNREVA